MIPRVFFPSAVEDGEFGVWGDAAQCGPGLNAVVNAEKGGEVARLFLLSLNLILVLVGGLIEIYAAIVIVGPLLIPIGARLGLDPIHLGIIFLANMELGFLAPPVGLNLLLSSSRFKKLVAEVSWAVLPMLGVLFVGLLVITYCPWLTTALPNWLK